MAFTNDSVEGNRLTRLALPLVQVLGGGLGAARRAPRDNLRPALAELVLET